MERSRERILTTHAGSLPRPAGLQALHVARSRGEAIDHAAFEDGIEVATRDVIARQVDVGLDVINNGEMGREGFFTYVRHRMTGFGGQSARPIMADLLCYPGYARRALGSVGDSVTMMQAPRAIGDVAYDDDGPIRTECEQLARCLEPFAGRYTEAFVSSPSPGIVAAAMENVHYDSLEDYVAAVSAALAVEYRAIVDAGFVLQIDAPDLAIERHTLFQDRPLEDFRAFLRVVIDSLNASLAGLPRDRIRLHVCWGNYPGPHDQDVPLADIWDEVERAHVGGFLLSMANPRHAHEVALFGPDTLGPDVVIVPGVIDTTTNYVEHPELVADRIERIAQRIGDPTRVIAGTDCGFETSAGFTTVDPDVAWAKFGSLRDGAAIASARLFGGGGRTQP